jgi:hypothetical protein
MARDHENYGSSGTEEPYNRYTYNDRANDWWGDDEIDDEETLDYIHAIFRNMHVPRYDWEVGGWVCSCANFRVHGKCQHVFRFRPQEDLPVSPEYL